MIPINGQAISANRISLMDISRFFLPIAFGAFVVSFIFPIFSWGISRFPDSETALAAFSLARGFYFIMASPILVLRQTVVAMVTGDYSYQIVRKFSLMMIGIFFLFFFLIGITPVSALIFGGLMGVEGQLLAITRQSFVIFSFLLLFAGWHLFLQGIAIIGGKTSLILYSMIIQLLVVVLSMAASVRIPNMNGAAAASLSYVFGMAAAAVFLAVFIHIKVPGFEKSNIASKNISMNNIGNNISIKKVFNFYYPLVLATIVLCVTIPIINAALSKTSNASLYLSAFDISWSLGWLALGCVEVSHQVPLYFLRRDNGGYKDMFRFLIIFGIIFSLLIAAIGYTQIGDFVLIKLMGIKTEISIIALESLQTLTILPVLYVVRQYFWGILMFKKDTKPVTWGKIINLVCLFSVLSLNMQLVARNPVVIIVLGMIISEIVEIIFLYFRTLKYLRNKQTLVSGSIG